MSLNGINAGYAATAATAIEKVQKADKATASSKESAYKSEAGATYETTVSASSKRTKNAALVAQLKADSEKRSAQMQSLVTQMFQNRVLLSVQPMICGRFLQAVILLRMPIRLPRQRKTFPKTATGVLIRLQTVFFHLHLLFQTVMKANGKMVKAVEKGFSLATKSWGQELPSISSDTHSAIMDKFDNWFKENGSTATTADLLK